MYITEEFLKEKGACDSGIKWFKENFPEGAELTEENIAKIQKCNSNFVWWFLDNFENLKLLYSFCGVNESKGVNGSDGVNWSKGINWSYGVNFSFGIYNCSGVSNALFLANNLPKYSIFGKVVTKKRFEKIQTELFEKLDGWNPVFHIKRNDKWINLNKQQAWSGMPKEAIKYVKSLPEYDAEMFFEITGIL